MAKMDISADGRFTPHARIHQRLEANFLHGALPAWLVLGDGTTQPGQSADAGSSISYVAPTADIPHALLTTASGASKQATLYGPLMRPSYAKAVRMGVTFYAGSSASVGVTFGFLGQIREARVAQFATYAAAEIWTKNSVGGRTAEVTEFQVETGAWHTMWITITPDGHFYWGRAERDSADQHRAKSTALDTAGNVWPFFRINTSSGSATFTTGKVASFEIDAWYQ